ncbi:MAG TPA: hypothetical protein VM680_16500 [Verrucomicrobiae bacterium]|nr:hypothetical protein [Verrucomicrobiae bacterium]
MIILNARLAFLTLVLSVFTRTLSATTPAADATPILWDPGTTHEGTRVVTNFATVSSNYLYRITTANPSLAAWRTALTVTVGEANLYVKRGAPPTIADSDFKSVNIGSDGFVLSSTQFAPNELWYILVEAHAGAAFSLISGAPYVQDIGAVAADGSSGSGEVAIGPEGLRFFSAQAPTDMLAWRLWLNGKTNTIFLRKSSVPLVTANDQSQIGQMLVVPPYLSGGQQYFIGVAGTPGTLITLDSRRQQIVDLAYGVSTATNDVTGFPYTTYRIQVPPQQIAWRVSTPGSQGNPNVSLRRNTVPNEFYNDALSELAPPLTDNIALVPPILSDGTFYVTVWSTNRHEFVLHNGPAVVTDINYIDTITNDDPDRVGWRYYRVTDISQQLGSLGWQLSVSNFAPGTRIAIRRNAAPGIWGYKTPTAAIATYHDLISVAQTLQEPGHQADVWYIGVYNPNNALGSFTLRTRELDPGPIFPPWQTAYHDRTNVPAGTWEYFRLDLPASPLPGLGWDLRLQNVAGSPVMVVRRDAFPVSLSGGAMSLPINLTNWTANGLWAAAFDFTGRSFGVVGNTNENGRILTMPLDRPLQPGRYYVGVQSAAGSTQAVSFRILSRWIGATMDIPVRTLNMSDEKVTNTIAPREAAYYAIQIPPNTRSLRVRVRALQGEAMVAVNRGVLPNTSATPQLFAFDITAGKTIQKTGDEFITLLPPRGKNVMPEGPYYIAVVGEGQNPADASHIGAGDSTYVVETLGPMAEPNLGVLVNELSAQANMVGGESHAYHFDTSDDILGFWIFIENPIGNPMAVSIGDTDLADPGLPNDFYGNDGGEVTGAINGTIIKVADPFPTETIMVKARGSGGNYPDASYKLRIEAIKPERLPFDGGVTNVANADADKGAFFYVDVPAGALGWDLRLTSVISGSPRLVVRREHIPLGLTTAFTLNMGQDTNWLEWEQWAPGRDWTDKGLSVDGLPEDGRIMAVGMGRPLEPGRYYIGVFGSGGPMNFTLLSRGIGPGFTIPVTPLAFDGGTNRVLALPPREAAYYSVDIPAGAQSWKVHLTATAGDSLLIASQFTLPNLLAGVNSTITNASGHKMQKIGDEYYLLLPPPGTNVLTPGRHYLTVVSEGQGSTQSRIGSGTSEFTLSSLGAAPVLNLGQLGVTDVVHTNTLPGGDTQIYQFSVPAGTLGIEARLEDRVWNPVMVLRGGAIAGPAGASQSSTPVESYGNENGTPSGIDVHPALINVGDVTNTLYTLIVMARSTNNAFTNTSYVLRLNASGTTTLAIDGGSASVTNHSARTWKYFRVTVPAGIDGWDLRLKDVYGGTPRLVIRREGLPSTVQTSPWSSPGAATNWPVNAQWAPLTDWTKRSLSATNANLNEDGQVFACGMGRPLEPGNYFIGVYNNHTTAATAYTILSRGIGAGLLIPVIDVPYVGSYSATLPARDAAYFRVIVPSNSPSWKVKVTGDSGEAMMVALRGNVPNIDMTQATASIANGKGMQKPGNEHFILVPAQGQTNLLSTTNYFAVISEGINPAGAGRIGTGSSSFTFESEGAAPVLQLGLVTSEDLVRPDRLQAGEVKLYQFLVPSGTLGLKVRLENREGNPAFVLRYGDKIPDPGAPVPNSDPYGNEGGYTSTDGSTLLFTVPNPLPGMYTVAVKGRPNAGLYSDAGYTLRVQEVLVPELNFSAGQNATNGLVNIASGILDDNERIFYKINIPPGDDVVGWKLELTQSSGLATMRVRKDVLPSDASSQTQMPFTSAAAVIVPPYLTAGVWYVEVKGTGSTAFQLTSNPLALERPVWTMPAIGEPNTTPGLTAPLFGDTGVGTNGVVLPGDSSTFLEQGTLHYYAVSVPTNNYGVLRAVLEAISGNPDLYLRFGVPPTLYHNNVGANGNIYDRSMLATATEYANWVPLDAKIESRLKPGLWYLAVRAAGNANTRYRLKLSVGNVAEIPVHGPLLSNQLLAGGDWRYYKFTAPDTLPGGFNVTFSEQSGDVVVYLRDTLPPGNGNTGGAGEYKDWLSDNKNQAAYLNFNTPGTYSFASPPIRPGSSYYIGVRAVNDAVFSIALTTNGAPNVAIPVIPFYGGNVSINLPPGTQAAYRIDVPTEATRWKHTSAHALGVQLFIEQGTLPTKGNTDDWRSPNAPNTSLNQYLLSPWPWIAGQPYFLVITNTTAQSQDVTFAMDGRNYQTDDNDNDALPDAWEIQYFGNNGVQIASGDPDRDGVTNYDEYLQGTNPNDALSFRARLTTSSIFGTVVRSPDLSTYELNSQVTLTPVPDPGYAFTGWLGSTSGLSNPLLLTMDGHKTLTARFKLAGDDFVTALPISGDVATIVSSNVGMTKEIGEPNHAGNPGGKSIWWRWTANSSREVTLTTAGTPFSTLLGVYTGNNVAALTRIASDSNSGGVTNRSIVNFNPISGQTYFIAIDGVNAASGRINLALTVSGTSGGIAPTLSGSVNAVGAQFSLVGTPNFTYAIETSTNFLTWTSLGAVTTDATGAGSFTHSNSPTNNSFYRTRH